MKFPMDRNLLSEAEPLIECGDWHPNAVSVDHVWLNIRLNAEGMRVVKRIDADATFSDRFANNTAVSGAMNNARVTHFDLRKPEGLEKLHRWIVKEESEFERPHPSYSLFPEELVNLMFFGYPYSVGCKKDSPLLGWFIVLGGKEWMSK
jgi:hypothetical protein